LKALEQTVESLEAPSADFDRKEHDLEATAKELKRQQQKILRLESLVDYQRSEIEVLKSSNHKQTATLEHQAPMLPARHKTAEEEKKAETSTHLSPSTSKPTSSEAPKSPRTSKIEHKSEKGATEEDWILIQEETTFPSSSEASSSAPHAKSEAQLKEEKKIEKERKKAEEKRREEEKKKEKERLKKEEKEKEKAKNAAKIEKEAEAREAARREKEMPTIENQVKALLREHGVTSDWKPMRDYEIDNKAFFLAVLSGSFEMQCWVFKTCKMNVHRNITLSLLTPLDDRLNDLKRGWNPQYIKQIKYSGRVRIIYRTTGAHASWEDPDPSSTEASTSTGTQSSDLDLNAWQDMDLEARCHPAHVAARYGQLEFLKWSLDNGYTVNELDSRKRSAVHHAARGGQVNVINFLIPRGAALGAKCDEKLTVAHYAAIGGHLPVLQLLKEEAMDLNSKNDEKMTPMLYAAGLGHFEIVKWLVTECEVPVTRDSSSWNQEKTEVHYVTLRRDLEMLQWLESQGSSLSAQAPSNATCLHYAIATNQLDLAKWLFERHVYNSKVKMSGDVTLMHLACTTGNQEMIQWLHNTLKAKLDVKTSKGQTLAHYAAKYGQLETLQWLEAQGVSMTKRTTNRMTILLYAARSGNAQLVQWIASRYVPTSRSYTGTGAEETESSTTEKQPKDKLFTYKDKRAVYGRSIIHYAAYSGHIGVLEFLKSEDVDLRRYDDLGGSITHHAARGQSVRTLQWLYDNSYISFTDKDSRGCHAASYALGDTQRWFSVNMPK
jgi:ankyrin repeat protein